MKKLQKDCVLLPAKLLVSKTFVPLQTMIMSVLRTTLVAVHFGKSEVSGGNTADNNVRYLDAFSLFLSNDMKIQILLFCLK